MINLCFQISKHIIFNRVFKLRVAKVTFYEKWVDINCIYFGGVESIAIRV